jgi:hypothetical protein
LRDCLAAIAIFCNEVKSSRVARNLSRSERRFRAASQAPEAMAEELKGRVVGAEGKGGQVRWPLFGGHVKLANRRKDGRDRPSATINPANARWQ